MPKHPSFCPFFYSIVGGGKVIWSLSIHVGRGEKGCRGKQAPFVDRDNRRQLSSSSSSFLRCPHIQERAPPFLSLPTTELARAASSLSLSLLGQAIMPPSPRHIPPLLLHSLARDTQGKEKWKKDVLGEKEMPVCPSPPPLLLSSVRAGSVSYKFWEYPLGLKDF